MTAKLYSRKVKNVNNVSEEIVKEILIILKKWSRSKLYSVLQPQWPLEVIAKTDLNYAINFYKTWILEEEDKKILYVIIPKALVDLFKNQEPQLIETINNWTPNSDKYRQVCFSTYELILNEIIYFVDFKYMSAHIHVDRARHLLQSKGINIQIPLDNKDVYEKVNTCLPLLEHLDSQEHSEDKSKIKALIHDLADFRMSFDNKDKALELIIQNLVDTATQRGISNSSAIKSIIKGISKMPMNQKATNCFKILNFIGTEKKIVNYDRIKNNLKLFENISSHIQEKWFLQQCNKGNSEHELVRMLSNFEPEVINKFMAEKCKKYQLTEQVKIKNQLRLKAMIDHIDNCLGFLNTHPKGKKQILDDLKNEDQYYQALSELEIAFKLSGYRRFSIALRERINSKTPDIILTINHSSKIIFEVTSMDLSDKLKDIGFVADDRDRVRQTIEDKIEGQIKFYAKGNHDPIILVIDKTRAHDIWADDIVNALKGTPTSTLFINENTGDMTQSSPFRAKDYIAQTMEGGDRLTAVIIYEQFFKFEKGSIELRGRIIPNPYASSKLELRSLGEIDSLLFQD